MSVNLRDTGNNTAKELFPPDAALAAGVILKNARIVDPSGQCTPDAAIAIHRETIIAVCPPAEAAARLPDAVTVDLNGLYCSAGFIDLHTHVTGLIGLPADDVGVYAGVTTLMDCGGSGAATFDAFRRAVIATSKTEIYALLHINRQGIYTDLQEGANLDELDIEAAVTAAKAAPGLIKGIKVRIEPKIIGGNTLIPAIRAKKAALRASLPLMIHIGDEPPVLQDTLELLDKGDIITHSFHGKPGKIVSETGDIRPCASAGRARGVLFDLGHGGGSFSVDSARKAIRAGFKPDTISSDMHAQSREKNLYSLAVTMSKFFTLGYGLNDIIALVTTAPARILGLAATHGQIAPGRKADLTIFTVKQGEFTFADSGNVSFTGDRLIRPEFTVKAGRPFTCKETAGGFGQRQT